MKITNEILKYKNSFTIEKDKRISAFIASLFSIIFSLSIVFELSNQVSGYVLAFLSLFTVLFLVANETIKVRQVKSFYSGKKGALIGATVTFILSLSLSSIGIFFWTNNSGEETNIINKERLESKSNIESEYLSQIDDLNTSSFEETKKYLDLDNDLTYWKDKSAGSLEERNTIRDHIRAIENKRVLASEDFKLTKKSRIDNTIKIMNSKLNISEIEANNNISNLNTNNFVSIVFFIMILLTEIGIVVLNKDIALHESKLKLFSNSVQADNYVICRKLLESLYLSNKKGLVTIQDALYSPVLNKLNWDDEKKWTEVKKLYNVLINIGILTDSKMVKKGTKKIITNMIVSDESLAFNKFDNYFEKMLTL